MQRRGRWVGVVVLLGLAAVGTLLEPVAWAERDKKPAAPPPKAPVATPKSPGRKVPSLGNMVGVPGGTFKMGFDDGYVNEKPVHEVSVASFSMDVTEVTVAAYKACVDAGSCNTTDLTRGAYCNWEKSGRSAHPINCVDWNQATAFCSWAGKRLPTQEEWEYAARGGSEGRKYPWGASESAKKLCFNRDHWPFAAFNTGTCSVGSFPTDKTKHGVMDMAGNVSEWTSTGCRSAQGVS
jgi:formylglycine-generating enzyme required for sulfatase activity